MFTGLMLSATCTVMRSLFIDGFSLLSALSSDLGKPHLARVFMLTSEIYLTELSKCFSGTGRIRTYITNYLRLASRPALPT